MFLFIIILAVLQASEGISEVFNDHELQEIIKPLKLRA